VPRSVHVRSRTEAQSRRARAVARACALHPQDGEILARALDLAATTPIGGRDAVYAATALLAGFDAVVSPDRDFGVVAGLRRVDPADALG
jgi:hypothetical protein